MRELEGRLVGAREDPATACMLPLDVVAAAQLAARLNLSVDDAKRVLMVKRQVICKSLCPLFLLEMCHSQLITGRVLFSRILQLVTLAIFSVVG